MNASVLPLNSNAAPSFAGEAIVAAMLTIAAALLLEGGLLASALGSYAHPDVAVYWLAVLAGVYQLYLCLRSGAAIGRMSLLLVWAVGTLAAMLLGLGPALFMAWQLLMISVTRAMLFHPRPLAFFADLGLSLIAGFSALWMLVATHSMLLTVWTFFLVQAGWSWIGQHNRSHADSTQSGLREFDAAHATATAAIRRLTRRNRA